MGKIEKIFYGFCILIVIYICFGFKVFPLILKDQLIKNLDENLTQKTTIENIEFNPLTLKAIIYNFKILDSSNTPTISFEKFLVDFSLLKSVEKKHISFKNIILKDAYINIIEEKDGSLNLSKLLKPTQEEPIKQESSSLDIKFLVSKLVLENINIDYLKQSEIPYSLNLKNINYTLYDLGTYKNILSSNDLKFKLNENTNVSIAGAFKLEPFKAYGKISIEDLRLKEFLSYKKDLFNFDINEKANLNLVLNYNIDTSKDLDLKLNSDKFEFNDINLKQKNTSLINLEKFDIKTFSFDLLNQNIILDNLDLQALKANMILDKNGINFAKLINQDNKEKTKNDENTDIQKESKPWNINLSNLKLNNSNFIFDDKIHDSISFSKDFSINLGSLKIINSDINLDSFNAKNPNISYVDNKNKLFVSTKNTNVNLDKLNLINGILDINKLEVSKENISFVDKKSNIDLNSEKAEIVLNNLKIDNNKTSINSIVLKNPSLTFNDIKSKIKVETSNLNLDINSLFVDKKDISIKDVKLIKPSINIIDKTNNIELNLKEIQLHINNLINKEDNLSVQFVKLLQPKLDFVDNLTKTKIEAKNLDLEIEKLSNTKTEFKIEKTNFDKPNISIILPKKNLVEKYNKSEIKITPKDEKSISKEQKNNKNKKESVSAKQIINIGPLNITNGIFSFEDKNLPIPFKTTVTKLNGKISEFKNIDSSTTNLQLKGVVDEYGVAKITGVVHPNNIKFLTDINMIFNNIAIKNFTPYSGKFVGREIKNGKLDLDLKYNIEKSNLDAKNNIVISKLELGEKVESPDAVSLPLDIAIALLRDSNGVIDINLPVSGNIDDPQFAINSIIWKAFVNLMTKAVTAPFSLLGAMFNFGEDEIKTVKFDLLEDEIGPIQKETLDKIAQILKSRKEIAIELIASFEENKESYELKKQKYLAKKKNDKNLKQEEIETLISKETIKIADLETIAKNRISNINKYLLKEKGINPKQVILTNKLENNNSSINLTVLKR